MDPNRSKKPDESKQKMLEAVPTNRHKPIPSDFGPLPGCFNDRDIPTKFILGRLHPQGPYQKRIQPPQPGETTISYSGQWPSTRCCVDATLCYAMVLPGRISGFRARFRQDSTRENLTISSPAGLRPAGRPILKISRIESGRNPTRKPDFRPGSTVASA